LYQELFSHFRSLAFDLVVALWVYVIAASTTTMPLAGRWSTSAVHK